MLLAVGFGLLVDLLVLGGLVWDQWLGPAELLLLAVLAGGIALIAGLLNLRQAVRAQQLSADPQQDLFPLATGEYLRGNWFETQQLCQRMLELNPRDLEARLLLATTCRRARRPAEAQTAFSELSRLAGTEKWKHEVDLELALLAEDADEAPDASDLSGGELAAAA